MIARALRWLRHALDIDHSPGASAAGTCPCALCQRIYERLDRIDTNDRAR